MLALPMSKSLIQGVSGCMAVGGPLDDEFAAPSQALIEALPSPRKLCP